MNMSLQDYQSPSQVSVNTKRLSAMIDLLHGDQNDDELLRVRDSSPTTTPNRIQAPHAQRKAKSNQGSPTKLPRSPAGVVSLNFPDKDHRSSMLSSYSGVVQEGVGVSYIVRNPSGASKQEAQPTLPTFPSAETLHASRKPTESSVNDEVVLKSVSSTKSRRNLSNGSKAGSRVSPDGPKQGSLKLLSINNKNEVAPSSSIGSGNLASESGSSSHKVEHPVVQRQKFDRISTPQVDSDTDSIATSIIPEVTTTKKSDEGVPPARSETTEYNPAIPPRSRNRPASKILIQDEDEHALEEKHSNGSSNLKRPDSPTRRSSVTNKSDTYYSASSFEVQDNRVEVDLTSQDEDNEDDEEDPVDAYLSRPLPTVPQAAQVHRDSTIKREQGREPEVVTTLTSSSVQDQMYDSDDQYEYIDESGRVIGGTPQKSTTSRKGTGRRSSSKKKKQQELRQFDVDTLSQLLNVTKGTLIGAEFANLGMKIEEKRALERLVDSLSRLTADMILDPDRYEEGLKRLNKAAKALEGF